jgi:hypothetical protein
MELVYALNQLWAGTILAMDFDLKKRSLKITVRVLENNIESIYDVHFDELESFYYANDQESLENFADESWDVLELSSIEYLHSDTINIEASSSNHSWLKHYSSKANFMIEIWDSYLFVRSRRLIINDEIFNLNEDSKSNNVIEKQL